MDASYAGLSGEGWREKNCRTQRILTVIAQLLRIARSHDAFACLSNIITRSAIAKILASSWVTMTKVIFKLRASDENQFVQFRRSDRDPALPTIRRETAPAGSSAMARAMAPRFCMPPLNSDGMRSP